MLIMQPSHRFLPSAQMTDDQRGFTLVELLVVLAIMSLAAVLFIGASGSSNGTTARGDLAKLEGAIVVARQRAITSAASQQVLLSDYSLALRPAVGNTPENLVFYADGSSNGGAILRGEKQLFTVRWIDGRIMK